MEDEEKAIWKPYTTEEKKEKLAKILHKYTDQQLLMEEIQEKHYGQGIFGLLSQLTSCPMVPKDVFADALNEIKSLSQNTYIIVILERESNKTVGLGKLILERKITHNFLRIAHIEDIVVDSNARQKGLGTRIMNILFDIAFEIGNSYKVILDCKPELVGFYQKCGMAKTGEIQMRKDHPRLRKSSL